MFLQNQSHMSFIFNALGHTNVQFRVTFFSHKVQKVMLLKINTLQSHDVLDLCNQQVHQVMYIGHIYTYVLITQCNQVLGSFPMFSFDCLHTWVGGQVTCPMWLQSKVLQPTFSSLICYQEPHIWVIQGGKHLHQGWHVLQSTKECP